MSAFAVLSNLNLILGGLVFLLGLVILRENPRQKLNLVVAFMLFFGGMGSLLTAMNFIAARATTPEGQVLVNKNLSYLWEFFFPTLLLFASIFPRERAFTRRIRWFPFLVYAPHAFHFFLLLGISLIGADIAVPGVRTPEVIRPLLTLMGLFFQLFLAIHNALFSLVNIGYGLASAVLLIQSYRHARIPRLREQLGVIGVGLIAGLAFYSLSSSIPTLLNIQIQDWQRALLTIAALTLSSGAITFSMVRYKFLDTKLLARRGILYGIASAILVGLYLTVVTQANQFISRIWGMDTRVFEPVFLIMALILFQPAITRLEERLEMLFLRDPTDYRNVLKRLGKDILTTIDLDEMLEQSIRTVAEALLARSASIAALAREGPLVHVGSGDSPPPDAVARLPEILGRIPADLESVRVDDPDTDLPVEDREFLREAFDATLVLPLRSKGENVGAVILGQKHTGTEYTSEDVALLKSLAGQMSVSVQNGLLLRDRVAMARYEEELNLARRIQSTFLPSEFPNMNRLEVYAVNTPSREVGGDFYDLVPASDGSFYLAIADVSGKGVPAALLTSMLQASLRTQAETIDSVSAIVSNINALVYSSTTTEQFATFFLARLDEKLLRMDFSNAGHNYPVVCRKNGDRRTLERGGMILGMFEGVSFEEDAIDLVPGDRIIFYTDGVSEAVNRSGQDYGEERLGSLAHNLPADLSAKEMTEHILEDLHQFLDGEEPQDDVTVMVLRVREASDEGVDRPQEAVAADAR